MHARASTSALSPFGADNRARLLDRYFEAAGTVTAENAWLHVYHLLLWIDVTTGLAHCYESDKAQPEGRWYPRTRRLHGWIADQMNIAPLELGGAIDWLFREALRDVAPSAYSLRSLNERVAEMAATYGPQEFPRPGEDSELEAIILEELADWLPRQPPHDVLASLTARARRHVSSENKRKNLLGEAFEDVIAAIAQQLLISTRLQVRTRSPLHLLPGFHEAPPREKVKKVDLAIVGVDGKSRTLVSCKWSIRADREEQFVSDFEAYSKLERFNESFPYVLITNEFDPARLKAAATRQVHSRPLFDTIVHVNPDAVLVAYGGHANASFGETSQLIESGRITSLQTWLQGLMDD